MSKILYCIAAVLMINCGQFKTQAQVLPKDGDTLNYRLIGFSFPEHKKATEYLLEVYEYSPDADVDIFIKDEPVLAKTFTRNRVIETVPEFDKQYKWHVKYLRKGNILDSTEYRYFTTGYHRNADTAHRKLKVLENKLQNKELLIFIDGTRTLHNTKGEAVWYLPDMPGILDTSTRVRDIHITPQNTITFLTDDGAYEIDYNTNVLWSGPNDGKISGDSIEQYHHQFTRLDNGNYLVMARDITVRKLPETEDTTLYKFEEHIIRKDGILYKKIYCGTLIEYDTAGNVVWHWRGSDHFTDADLFTKRTVSGTANVYTHANSFYFDTDKNIIYIGFRDISRIVKISYPSGKVLAQYGENYTKSNDVIDSELFYSHHNNTITSDGKLLLYNNNVLIRNNKFPKEGAVSSILLLNEPGPADSTLSVFWEFKCDIDTFTKSFTLTGGSVAELRDKSFLVSMGSINRNFIVTRKKEIVWNAVYLKKGEKGWESQSNYKTSAIESLSDLEKLIFVPRDRR